jgi:peptidoglycan/LPS O-acetylase OafA/YrhL
LNLLFNNLQDIFRRNRGRYPSLDGLRAIAVLLVLLFHCFYLNYAVIGAEASGKLMQMMSPWFNWVWQGDKGVDLFFVLSGFLIAMLLLREHKRTGSVSLKRFYRHRAARILPAYLLLLGYAWWIGMPYRESVWGNLLFINDLLPAGHTFVPWSWSITVEVQFYLLFPLLLPLLLGSRRPLWVVFWAVVLAWGLRLAVMMCHSALLAQPFYQLMFAGAGLGGWWDAVYIHLATRAGPIVLGIAAAVLHVCYAGPLQSLLQRHPVTVSMLGIMAVALMWGSMSVPYHDPGSEYFTLVGETGNLWLLGLHRNLFALAVAVLLLFTLHPVGLMGPLTALLSSRLLVPLAKVSYSLYLFHVFIVKWVFQSLQGWWPEAIGTMGWMLTGVALTLMLAFLLSMVSYALVEKPFNDLARRGHRAAMGSSSDRGE